MYGGSGVGGDGTRQRATGRFASLPGRKVGRGRPIQLYTSTRSVRRPGGRRAGGCGVGVGGGLGGAVR